MSLGDRLFGILVGGGALLLLIGIPLVLLFGGVQNFALGPLRRRFSGINIHDSPEPGDVMLVYHTYRGFLVWCVQEEHRVFAAPEDASTLLGRLLRFNLTWGMLSYGLVFVPVLSIVSYFAQHKSIERQSRKSGAAAEVDGIAGESSKRRP